MRKFSLIASIILLLNTKANSASTLDNLTGTYQGSSTLHLSITDNKKYFDISFFWGIKEKQSEALRFLGRKIGDKIFLFNLDYKKDCEQKQFITVTEEKNELVINFYGDNKCLNITKNGLNGRYKKISPFPIHNDLSTHTVLNNAIIYKDAGKTTFLKISKGECVFVRQQVNEFSEIEYLSIADEREYRGWIKSTELIEGVGDDFFNTIYTEERQFAYSYFLENKTDQEIQQQTIMNPYCIVIGNDVKISSFYDGINTDYVLKRGDTILINVPLPDKILILYKRASFQQTFESGWINGNDFNGNIKFLSAIEKGRSLQRVEELSLDSLLFIKSHNDLINTYKSENVKKSLETSTRGEFYCSILFPSIKEKTVYFFWKDGSFEDLEWIETRNDYRDGEISRKSLWKTMDGITLGMPIEKLVEINNQSVNFYGFEWDFGGAVFSYNNGILNNKNISLILSYDNVPENLSNEFYSNFVGDDKEISSTDPLLKKTKANLFVTVIRLFKVDTPAVSNSNSIVNEEKIKADFPGGESAWKRYLERNLNANVPYENGAAKGSYEVLIKFIVGEDGSIKHIEAETKFGFGMEEEVIKLIRKTGKWVPAIQNGNHVSSYVRKSFTFVVE